MKKIILAFLIITSGIAFAEEQITLPTPITEFKPMTTLPEPEKLDKKGFFYVRFTAMEGDIANAGSVLPGLGFGYRRLAGTGAADISISGIGRKEHKNARFMWSAPKASYLHYLQPDEKKSVYLGGGLAWGGISTKKGDNFIGIIPSVTVGYEFTHKASFLGFGEFTISQPSIAVYRKGPLSGPIAELSMGIGF